MVNRVGDASFPFVGSESNQAFIAEKLRALQSCLASALLLGGLEGSLLLIRLQRFFLDRNLTLYLFYIWLQSKKHGMK